MPTLKSKESPNRTVVANFKMTEDMSKQLDALEKQYKLNRSEVIRQLLQQALES